MALCSAKTLRNLCSGLKTFFSLLIRSRWSLKTKQKWDETHTHTKKNERKKKKTEWAKEFVTSYKKVKQGEVAKTKREREKLTKGEQRERERYVTLSSSNSAKTWLGSPRYYHNRDFLMEQIKRCSSGRPADAWWISRALPAPTNSSKTPQWTLHTLPEDTETCRRTAATTDEHVCAQMKFKKVFLFSVFCLARDLKPFDPLYELHFGSPVWWMTRFKTATEFSRLSLCARLTAQTSPLLSFQENRPPQLEVLEVSNIQFLLNPKGGKLQSVQ